MAWLDRYYTKNPSIVSRKIADEVILVPIRQKTADLKSIYSLNEVGARIWNLIDGQRRPRQIKAIILQEFQANETQIEHDLIGFLEQLEQIGAIMEANNEMPQDKHQ